MIRRAYTLIELLVVMGIMGLLLAVGIPSFGNYNNFINFHDKVDEIDSLLNQTYLMAHNPESFETTMYQVSVGEDKKTLVLESCVDVDTVSNLCDQTKDTTRSIKTVTLSNGEIFQAALGFDKSFLVCPTNLEATCVLGENSPAFSFADARVSKQADFVVRTSPFKVDTEISNF